MNLYQLLRLLHLLELHRYLLLVGIISPRIVVHYTCYRWHLRHPDADWLDAIVALSCGKTTWFEALRQMQTEVFPPQVALRTIKRLAHVLKYIKRLQI